MRSNLNHIDPPESIHVNPGTTLALKEGLLSKSFPVSIALLYILFAASV